MTTEATTSQQSHASSKHSTTSQTSGQRPITYEDFRPASRATPARDSTPSTSLSSEPCRERPEPVSPLSQDSIGRRLDNSPSSAVEKPTSPSVNARTQAQKRTASGDVKQSWSGHSEHSHSRNTSSTSKTSHISELSNDLRTRLSYAMFKVQNGWQSHSLKELEAMAAQRLSPATVTQDRPFSALSPPHSSANLPSSQGTQPFSPGRLQQQPYQLQPSQAAMLSPPHTQTTYEDFFRDEARKGGIPDSTKRKPSSRQQSGPSLAPPVDILPRTAARRTFAINGHQPPPPLQTGTFPALPHPPPSDNGTMIPSTPPPAPHNKPSTIQTPSQQQQKSAMEQDAVETLMFMSSPGNSGYHPAFKSPTSPPAVGVGRYPPVMLTPTTAARRGVGFASSREEMMTSPKRGPTSSRLSTAADIDRVLDEMRDERYSSSEEDDNGDGSPFM
ncbi:MAG: hypothetical protein Q9220_006327 [cf. Caloplaca sp. 1 TL-2023]